MYAISIYEYRNHRYELAESNSRAGRWDSSNQLEQVLNFFKGAHEETFSRSIELPLLKKRGDSRFSKGIRKNETGIQISSKISEETGIIT